MAISLALHAFLLLQENRSINMTPATDPLHARHAGPLAARLRTNAQQAAAPVAQTTAAAAGAPRQENARKAPPPDASRASMSMAATVADTASVTAETAASGNADAGHPASVNGEGEGKHLRQYRIDLAMAARRFRNYPAAARNAGIGGITGVRVVVAADGQSQGAELHSSSGNALLDAAALEMLGNAAQATAVPPALRGRAFDVLIPVAFDPDPPAE
ncbi:putative TonB family protein [Sterolibacterium denitrificans]|uniref:TonB family protein n=1 Tax=Sterolibacterium denitrificans TaxID=157592 RepID=A0A7Z7MUV0_9PROT|nr:putative TonB family protein [Sterolibacterium denitrificans]